MRRGSERREAEIGAELNKLDPHAVVMDTSGRASLEASYALPGQDGNASARVENIGGDSLTGRHLLDRGSQGRLDEAEQRSPRRRWPPVFDAETPVVRAASATLRFSSPRPLTSHELAAAHLKIERAVLDRLRKDKQPVV